MNALATKEARIEHKTTLEIKEFLKKAAALNGTDLSSFIINSSVDKARTILSQQGTISLSEEGQLNLIKMLQSPAEPTKAMKELRNLPRLKVIE